MPDHIATVVRVPLEEIVQAIKQRNHITDPFDEVRVEDDCLTFYFSRERGGPAVVLTPAISRIERVSVEELPTPKRSRRRARKRRNRMKTRGWDVVTKIVTPKGQTAVVYKPFVEALSEPGLSVREKRSRVQGILRANSNKPSPGSVDYFLENTLQYLASRDVAEAGST